MANLADHNSASGGWAGRHTQVECVCYGAVGGTSITFTTPTYKSGNHGHRCEVGAQGDTVNKLQRWTSVHVAEPLNHYSADPIDQAYGFLVRSADINSAFPFSWTASPIVSFGNDFLCWLFLFSVVVRLRSRRSGLLRLSSSQVVTGSLSFALLCLTSLSVLTSYWNQNLWGQETS